MTDTSPPQPEKPRPSPRAEDNVHDRPEVKPLIDKAGAKRETRIPQGTMKTGADVPGGGGTKSLEVPVTPPQDPTPPEAASE